MRNRLGGIQQLAAADANHHLATLGARHDRQALDLLWRQPPPKLSDAKLTPSPFFKYGATSRLPERPRIAKAFEPRRAISCTSEFNAPAPCT